MQIIRKDDVLSLINETAKNFDYKTKVPIDISEDDETEDESNKDSTEYEKFQNKGGGPTRQSRHTVGYTNPETGKERARNLDYSEYKKQREYVGGSNHIVQTVSSNLKIPKNDASKVVYKMRKDYRQGASPEEVFKKYGIINYDNNDLNELTAKEVVNKSVPMYFKSGGVKGNPDAYLNTDEQTGKQELLVPVCMFFRVAQVETYAGFTTKNGKTYKPGDILTPEQFANLENEMDEQTYKGVLNFLDPIVDGQLFKGHYKDELLALAKTFRLNPAIVYCQGGIKPKGTPQGEAAKVLARFSGESLYQRIIDKKLLRNREDVMKFISEMRAEVKSGADPEEILYERGVFAPNEKINDSYISELTGIKSGHSKLGGRASISELLKTKLNEILRINFGTVARDAKTSSDINFTTPLSRENNNLFDEKALPPIVLSSKYVNRNNILDNDNIVIEGFSYNNYNSLYDFLEKVAGLKKGREKTYYLAYQFNQKNRRWDEARPAVKSDRGRTPIYDLDKEGYKDEEFNVVVRLDWRIEGKRIENEFQWTFSIGVKLGKKGVDDFQIFGGLKELNLSNIENYFSKNLIATQTAKTLRSKTAYSETSDDNTILDDPRVRAALKKTINEMMQKIKNEFNPEEKFLSFADIEPFKDVPGENLQEKRELITKYLINKIIQEIKNPR